MSEQRTEIDTQLPTKALLQLCKRLERAWNLSDILDAIAPVAEQVLGYRHIWLGLFGMKPGIVSVISHLTAGVESDRSRQAQAIDIPIAGDQMLQEIMTADHVVVVEDARTDPRTNKDIVAQLHNRTIINVPLTLAEQRLGALGMGLMVKRKACACRRPGSLISCKPWPATWQWRWTGCDSWKPASRPRTRCTRKKNACR